MAFSVRSGGSNLRLYGVIICMFVVFSLLHMVVFYEQQNDARKAELSMGTTGQDRLIKLGVPDSMDIDARGRSVFEPGSLDMDRTAAVNSCYVNREQYKIFTNVCTYSEEYKLLYYLLPKSGSSTGRHVMKHDFGAAEIGWTQCKKLMQKEGILRTATVRSPLSRFYASYDEAFVRRLAEQETIPKMYRRFMKPFWGWEYKQYAALFDTPEGVKQLTDSFEAFVQDYDAKYVFDIHLGLQMAFLWDQRLDRHLDMDIVFDTHDMENQFTAFAEKVGAPKPKIIHGRSYPRRFNVSAISDATIQKICRLSALDFCCLNYRLPKQCTRDDIPRGERVKCEWVQKDGKQYIQPIFV